MSDLTDQTAVTAIAQLAIEANQVLEDNVRSGSVYLIRDRTGEPTFITAPLTPFDREAFDLESLKRMADQDKSLPSQVVDGVYISDTAVILVTEDDGHRWKSTLKLPLHPAFAYLTTWTKNRGGFGHKEFVRLLRTELREYVPEGTAATFEALKFTDNRESTGQVRAMSSALESSIHQEVKSAQGEEVPETLNFAVPVFDIPETRGDVYGVNVYVEYDHQQARFLLYPIHGELRKAQEDAVRDLRDNLEQHAAGRFPVYYGTP